MPRSVLCDLVISQKRELSAMKTLSIAGEELEELKRLQPWPADLSANHHGAIWQSVTFGWTPFSRREDIRGKSKIIDEVADEYLRVRPGGGRFFMRLAGAFYSPEDEPGGQFVAFQFENQE